MYELLTYCKRFSGVCVVISATMFASSAVAEPNVTPAVVEASLEVVLTLVDASGEIVLELSEKALLEMDQVVVITGNEFVDGVAEFSGPLARDVIALMGEVEIEQITLTAVNDYSVNVPVADFLEYDVIFAMYQDGEKFSTRDKGPIWVIYPMTDVVMFQDRVYNDRLIWQLVRITAK